MAYGRKESPWKNVRGVRGKVRIGRAVVCVVQELYGAGKVRIFY